MPRESAGRSKWKLTSTAFDKLLERLSPDRELAGVEFQELRRRLILFFSYDGFTDPEQLADETLDRVAKRLGDSDIGNLPGYSRGVARLVRQEAKQNRLRENQAARQSTLIEISRQPELIPDDRELRQRCLDHCLKALKADERELVVGYYDGEKRNRIESRGRLARRYDIEIESLRNKVLGIRKRLESCMGDCPVKKGGI